MDEVQQCRAALADLGAVYEKEAKPYIDRLIAINNLREAPRAPLTLQKPETCNRCPHMGPYGHGEPPDCGHPLRPNVGPYEFANPRTEPPMWCPLCYNKPLAPPEQP